MAPSRSGNHLLELISEHARGTLALTQVELRAREVIQQPGVPVLHAYFPVTAVVSLVSTMRSGDSAEVALIGREGMVGLPGLLAPVEHPTSAVVQVPGAALRVSVAALRSARRTHASVRRALDLYTEVHLIQVAQTAACNRLHSVEARLARWLLAAHDRIQGDELVVSQELIADLLGVHRPTVSAALQRLQTLGAIARNGRAVVISDRARLTELTCECYGVLVREFARLLENAPATTLPDAPNLVDAGGTNGSSAALAGMREIAGRLLLANLRAEEARERAEAANRAKDQFLAMVSHDLRTPLHAILGWCEIMKAQPQQSPERGVQVIERNARAQLKLVDDLLDAARMTSATLTIQSTDVALAPLVRETAEALAPAAEQKQIAFRVSIADERLTIPGDAARLQQVLTNLLANAVKFTDAGGAVEIRVAAHAAYAQITVRDTGKGIAPEVLPHVFERFRQGDAPERRQQGLGLGLSIAREIVHLHGGTIALDSPGENQGTTCTIELPLATRARVQHRMR